MYCAAILVTQVTAVGYAGTLAPFTFKLPDATPAVNVPELNRTVRVYGFCVLAYPPLSILPCAVITIALAPVLGCVIISPMLAAITVGIAVIVVDIGYELTLDQILL